MVDPGRIEHADGRLTMIHQDRLMPLVERDHPIEDATMRIPVEVLTVDDLGCEIERVVVDENRTEHRSLGFEIVRKRALRRGKSSIGHEERKICKRGVTKMVAGISTSGQ